MMDDAAGARRTRGGAARGVTRPQTRGPAEKPGFHPLIPEGTEILNLYTCLM